MDGGDVAVVEGGEDPRLALEARASPGVPGEEGRQHLERHVSAQVLVEGPRDLAHATGSELFANLVAAERPPRERLELTAQRLVDPLEGLHAIAKSARQPRVARRQLLEVEVGPVDDVVLDVAREQSVDLLLVHRTIVSRARADASRPHCLWSRRCRL